VLGFLCFGVCGICFVVAIASPKKKKKKTKKKIGFFLFVLVVDACMRTRCFRRLVVRLRQRSNRRSGSRSCALLLAARSVAAVVVQDSITFSPTEERDGNVADCPPLTLTESGRVGAIAVAITFNKLDVDGCADTGQGSGNPFLDEIRFSITNGDTTVILHDGGFNEGPQSLSLSRGRSAISQRKNRTKSTRTS
jgi:hypothetical protein